ncbi:hypothetical protein GQ600_659 [Phytophthora cactorum]|nr:hypothetical protein GQ600_659 [Phytophthora cactorum]
MFKLFTGYCFDSLGKNAATSTHAVTTVYPKAGISLPTTPTSRAACVVTRKDVSFVKPSWIKFRGLVFVVPEHVSCSRYRFEALFQSVDHAGLKFVDLKLQRCVLCLLQHRAFLHYTPDVFPRAVESRCSCGQASNTALLAFGQPSALGCTISAHSKCVLLRRNSLIWLSLKRGRSLAQESLLHVAFTTLSIHMMVRRLQSFLC